jgi:c-di-GMP-related signal transduction protein
VNNDLNELNRLREMEEEVAQELSIRADTLRRMLSKVEEYSESHRAHGLPDDLLNILKDDLYNTTHPEENPSIH